MSSSPEGDGPSVIFDPTWFESDVDKESEPRGTDNVNMDPGSVSALFVMGHAVSPEGAVITGAPCVGRVGKGFLAFIDLCVHAALTDGGATLHTSLTTEGVICGTFRPDDGKPISIADAHGSLACNGSYLYAFELEGENGTKVSRIARRAHTPGGICNIHSEPLEIYGHGQEFVSNAAVGRVMRPRLSLRVSLIH